MMEMQSIVASWPPSYVQAVKSLNETRTNDSTAARLHRGRTFRTRAWLCHGKMKVYSEANSGLDRKLWWDPRIHM